MKPRHPNIAVLALAVASLMLSVGEAQMNPFNLLVSRDRRRRRRI